MKRKELFTVALNALKMKLNGKIVVKTRDIKIKELIRNIQK